MSAVASAAPLVVLGDALLDRDLEGTVERLSPEAPVPVIDDPVERSRPGGAALAAALAAAERERPVRLVTAVAADESADGLRRLIAEAGVELVELGFGGGTPEKIRLRARGRTLLRIDRGGRGDTRVVGDEAGLAAARAALEDAAGVLVSDYGRGVAALLELRHALERLPATVPLVWDPHPRGAAPVSGALLVTPNEAEAAGFVGEGEEEAQKLGAADHGRAARRAAELCLRWGASCVCVTRGRHGAVLVGADGSPLVVPAPAADEANAGDPCGAGDRFASRAALSLASGKPPAAAVGEATAAASAFVAAGGAALAGRPHSIRGTAERTPAGGAIGAEAALAVARRTRAHGGTVVATGGCFDLLHAGHVSVLRAARALGDCLVVLLNSDESMRRLKGPDRPLVNEGDRAAVLAALDAVDAVMVFEEETPADALERLRPDVFAKGGDYAGRRLPEAEVVERHGGQVVVLPYVAGRSTTRLIEEVALRGGR